MCLQKRFRYSAAAHAVFYDFYSCFQRYEVTDADVNRLRTLFRRNHYTYGLTVFNQIAIYRLADQSALCHSNSRLTYCKPQMARKAASVRVRYSLPVNEKNVRLLL